MRVRTRLWGRLRQYVRPGQEYSLYDLCQFLLADGYAATPSTTQLRGILRMMPWCKPVGRRRVRTPTSTRSTSLISYFVFDFPEEGNT